MSEMTTTIQWQNNRECVHDFQRTPSLWEIKDAMAVVAAVIDRIHKLGPPVGGPIVVTDKGFSAEILDQLDSASFKRLIGDSLVIIDRDDHAIKFGGQSPRDRVCERFWSIRLPLPGWMKFQ